MSTFVKLYPIKAEGVLRPHSKEYGRMEIVPCFPQLKSQSVSRNLRMHENGIGKVAFCFLKKQAAVSLWNHGLAPSALGPKQKQITLAPSSGILLFINSIQVSVSFWDKVLWRKTIPSICILGGAFTTAATCQRQLFMGSWSRVGSHERFTISNKCFADISMRLQRTPQPPVRNAPFWMCNSNEAKFGEEKGVPFTSGFGYPKGLQGQGSRSRSSFLSNWRESADGSTLRVANSSRPA